VASCACALQDALLCLWVFRSIDRYLVSYAPFRTRLPHHARATALPPPLLFLSPDASAFCPRGLALALVLVLLGLAVLTVRSPRPEPKLKQSAHTKGAWTAPVSDPCLPAFVRSADKSPIGPSRSPSEPLLEGKSKAAVFWRILHVQSETRPSAADAGAPRGLACDGVSGVHSRETEWVDRYIHYVAMYARAGGVRLSLSARGVASRADWPRWTDSRCLPALRSRWRGVQISGWIAVSPHLPIVDGGGCCTEGGENPAGGSRRLSRLSRHDVVM